MTLTKKQLLAIDNVAILMRAKDRGLKLHPEDLRINYAEMDLALNSLEDNWQQLSTVIMIRRFKKWLSQVEKWEDLDQEGMGLGLHLLILDFIQSIWDYGQRSADAEAQSLEQSFAEGSGGKPGLTDLTNSDAFEWYDLYTRELAKQTEKAVFHYMQPLILEKLDQGKVGLELAAALEDDFRRFGQVRTQIIARTESNKAFNWGRRYRFDGSPAIAGYRYSAILDERTTEICQALHGHSWEINDPGLDPHTPPNHYQCRSVLVPISKYRSHTFDPPPSGWESSLPAKERKVFEKFKDSTFYPKADTVIKMQKPKMDPPKVKAKPKKQPAASQEGKHMEHLVLSPDDIEALDRFDDLIKGMDFAQDRRKLAKELLKRAGLSHIKVGIKKIMPLGSVTYYDKAKIEAVSLDLDSQDFRDHTHHLGTIFHEFYHANYDGLSHDYKRNKYDIGPGLSRDEWLRWEESATESAAHYMLQQAGYGSAVQLPYYSNYLTETLPLLKQLPGWEDCVTVEDFGAKFMKYRFSKAKKAKWGDMIEATKDLEMDWGEYYKPYEEYILENEDEIAMKIFASNSSKNKETHKDWHIKQIKEGMKKRKPSYFRQALIAAMQKVGIR